MRKTVTSIISLIMALSAMMPTVMADSRYSDYDVENDSDANWGDNFGIMSGYEDGTFRPNNPITRAEFVKAMITMGEGVFSEKGNVQVSFSDVDESHWAYSEISKAVSIGFVSGYEDGTFRPDDNITYEQAVTMIFTALGYKPVADVYGGYPHAYISLAYYNRLFKTIDSKRNGCIEMYESKQKTNITRRDSLCILGGAMLIPICYVTNWDVDVDGSHIPVYNIGGDGVVTKTIYSIKNVTVVTK